MLNHRQLEEAQQMNQMNAMISGYDELRNKNLNALNQHENDRQTAIQSTMQNSEDVVNNQNRFLNNNKKNRIIKCTAIGAVSGLAGAGVIIFSGGLGTVPAIGVACGLMSLGGLAGAGTGFTIEMLGEISRVKAEDFDKYCSENPKKISLFCFSSALVFNILSLKKLGCYTNKKAKDILALDLARANKITIENLSTEERKHFSLFVENVSNVETLFENDPEHFNRFLDVAAKKNIFGSSFSKWSIGNYQWCKKLEERGKNLNENILEIEQQKRVLESRISKIKREITHEIIPDNTNLSSGSWEKLMEDGNRCFAQGKINARSNIRSERENAYSFFYNAGSKYKEALNTVDINDYNKNFAEKRLRKIKDPEGKYCLTSLAK